jgi:hypothetical protein
VLFDKVEWRRRCPVRATGPVDEIEPGDVAVVPPDDVGRCGDAARAGAVDPVHTDGTPDELYAPGGKDRASDRHERIDGNLPGLHRVGIKPGTPIERLNA